MNRHCFFDFGEEYKGTFPAVFVFKMKQEDNPLFDGHTDKPSICFNSDNDIRYYYGLTSTLSEHIGKEINKEILNELVMAATSG